jgi:hypothetical protein
MVNDGSNPIDDVVLHYAQTQGLDVSDPQVLKYRASMTGRKVKEEKRPARLHIQRPDPEEVRKKRYADAVTRYAESQGLAEDDPQVLKYAQGLLDLFQEVKDGQDQRDQAH